MAITKKMVKERIFVYKSLHGRDDLLQFRKTIQSIENMPKGHSWDVQVLVESEDGQMFRIKGMRYDRETRSVRITVDLDHPVQRPDYSIWYEDVPPIVADTEYEEYTRMTESNQTEYGEIYNYPRHS